MPTHFSLVAAVLLLVGLASCSDAGEFVRENVRDPDGTLFLPPAPDSVRAVAHGDTITVTWVPTSPSADLHVVERSANDGPFIPIAEVDRQQASIDDVVDGSGRFRYRVQTRVGSEASPFVTTSEVTVAMWHPGPARDMAEVSSEQAAREADGSIMFVNDSGAYLFDGAELSWEAVPSPHHLNAQGASPCHAASDTSSCFELLSSPSGSVLALTKKERQVHIESFDLETRSWKLASSIDFDGAVGALRASVAGDQVLLGAVVSSGDASDLALVVYHPASGAVEHPAHPVFEIDGGFALGVLSDGRVVIHGATTFVSDPRLESWTVDSSAGETIDGRNVRRTLVLPDNRLLFVGRGASYLFDADESIWERLGWAPVSGLAVDMLDGGALLIGNRTYVYEPFSDEWTTIDSTPATLIGEPASAAVVRGRRILITSKSGGTSTYLLLPL